MKTFAQIDNDNIVVQVISNVPDEITTDADGQNYINNTLGLSGTWLSTDPSTKLGVSCATGLDGFRLNHAKVGHTYDPTIDGFVLPQPYPSWILNPETGHWMPPIPCPLGDTNVVWDETTQSWLPGPERTYTPVLNDRFIRLLSAAGIPVPTLSS